MTVRNKLTHLISGIIYAVHKRIYAILFSNKFVVRLWVCKEVVPFLPKWYGPLIILYYVGFPIFMVTNMKTAIFWKAEWHFWAYCLITVMMEAVISCETSIKNLPYYMLQHPRRQSSLLFCVYMSVHGRCAECYL
jgi:hypothetical protein